MNQIASPSFEHWNGENKVVLLQTDYNIVPFDPAIDHPKLIGSLPTIDALLKQNMTVIILTHRGRPDGFDQNLSTVELLPWFKRHDYQIAHASSIEVLRETLKNKISQLILFENIRFFQPGAQQEQLIFELAALGEFYVNDAFGSLHRTSLLTQLALQFPENCRSIGLLVSKELRALGEFKKNMNHPTIFIIAGGKGLEKISLLQLLLRKIDYLLVGPAVSELFKQPNTAQNPVIQDIIDLCSGTNTKVLLPEDTITGMAKSGKNETFCIGPKTLAVWGKCIVKAHTIIVSGLQGFLDIPESLVAQKAIFELIASNNAQSIIAGGESSSFAYQCGLQTQTNVFISTGGGATLTYLAHLPLEGLKPFLKI